MILPDKIKPILEKVKSELRLIFGKRIKRLVLFGSYARGDYSEGSDIDLLLILDSIQNPNLERSKYFQVISKISLANDVVISLIVIDENNFYKKKSPLLLNIGREGKKI